MASEQAEGRASARFTAREGPTLKIWAGQAVKTATGSPRSSDREGRDKGPGRVRSPARSSPGPANGPRVRSTHGSPATLTRHASTAFSEGWTERRRKAAFGTRGGRAEGKWWPSFEQSRWALPRPSLSPPGPSPYRARGAELDLPEVDDRGRLRLLS